MVYLSQLVISDRFFGVINYKVNNPETFYQFQTGKLLLTLTLILEEDLLEVKK